MKIIGITGGVGAGKTTVLSLIKKNCNCHILLADEAAHVVKKKGNKAFDELVDLLGRDILAPDGEIDKGRMAGAIFAQGNKDLLLKVNEIIHPRVKEFILNSIEEYRREGDVDYFFIEAALLIEDGYRDICDELWYIYAPEDIRADRLRSGRGYSDDKIKSIMDSQSDDETFRKNCDRIIENAGDIDRTESEIVSILSGENKYGRG